MGENPFKGYGVLEGIHISLCDQAVKNFDLEKAKREFELFMQQRRNQANKLTPKSSLR